MHQGGPVDSLPAGECIRGCLRSRVRAEESAGRCQWGRRDRKTGWLRPNIDKENSSCGLSCFYRPCKPFSPFTPLSPPPFCLFTGGKMCNKHLFMAYLPCVTHSLNRDYKHTSESHTQASVFVLFLYCVRAHVYTRHGTPRLTHFSWVNPKTLRCLLVQLLTLPRLQ